MSIINPERLAAILSPVREKLAAAKVVGSELNSLSLLHGQSRDSLILPVRPAQLRTPSEVNQHVSRLLDYTQAWTDVRNRTQTLLANIAEPLKRAQEALRDETGVRPLQDKVAKLTRERHAAVA